MSTDTATPDVFKVRRISFEHPEDGLDRHFMSGDLVLSHIIATLSAIFPQGEDYFVRSVRNYRDQITDPLLKKQVGAFIGQEAIHGREHRALNDHFEALGFPSGRIDAFIGRRLRFQERFAPPKFRLAATAALEHYTATLAEVLLGDPEARALFGDSEEVRSLLLWHAIEESEHKAVAFDVYQAVTDSDDRYRARVMNLTTVTFIGISVFWTLVSLSKDPASRDLRRLGRSFLGLRGSPWLSKAVRRKIRDYNRPGFHPNDHDATELLAEWRERLFGEQGELVDRLAS
ncbi:MAG TPA: metal-dependent hydrolase [Aquihabitans sp.]|nr:metal-dependent hydrolase [Aquihabitans sp.]